ncbi:Arc family DNA-binding protein [Pararhodobacter aggregans]
MAKSKREEMGQIVIRPPEGMRERIKAAAEKNGRSMNAEVVAALEDAFPPIIRTGDVLRFSEENMHAIMELEKAAARWLRIRKQVVNYQSDDGGED